MQTYPTPYGLQFAADLVCGEEIGSCRLRGKRPLALAIPFWPGNAAEYVRGPETGWDNDWKGHDESFEGRRKTKPTNGATCRLSAGVSILSLKTIGLLAFVALAFAIGFLVIVMEKGTPDRSQVPRPQVALEPFNGKLSIQGVDDLRVGGRKGVLCGVAFAKPAIHAGHGHGGGAPRLP